MAIVSESLRGNLPTTEKLPWEGNADTIKNRIGKYLTNSADPVLVQTLAQVDKAFLDFHAPKETRGLDQRKFAFVVHPRDPWDQDIERHFPGLSDRYMPHEEVLDIFESMPPFIIGEFRGLKNMQGDQIDGWLLSAPITPEVSLSFATHQGIKTAREKVVETARFARTKLGVEILGLGETLGTLSKFGEQIEENVPEILVTTGHAYTVYLIGEALRRGAEAVNIDLKKATLAIVGAGGAIGSSTAGLLKDEIGNLTLYDKGSQAVRLERLAHNLNGGRVRWTTDIEDALSKADLIVSATSDMRPFITHELVSPGTVIVDDSQPVNMTAAEAVGVRALLLHPVAQVPEGVERDFNYGLPKGSEFGCAAEVMTLSALGDYEQRTIGRLSDPGKARQMGELAGRVGFKLAPLQNHGSLISDEYLQQVRQARRSLSRKVT